MKKEAMNLKVARRSAWEEREGRNGLITISSQKNKRILKGCSERK